MLMFNVQSLLSKRVEVGLLMTTVHGYNSSTSISLPLYRFQPHCDADTHYCCVLTARNLAHTPLLSHVLGIYYMHGIDLPV